MAISPSPEKLTSCRSGLCVGCVCQVVWAGWQKPSSCLTHVGHYVPEAPIPVDHVFLLSWDKRLEGNKLWGRSSSQSTGQTFSPRDSAFIVEEYLGLFHKYSLLIPLLEPQRNLFESSLWESSRIPGAEAHKVWAFLAKIVTLKPVLTQPPTSHQKSPCKCSCQTMDPAASSLGKQISALTLWMLLSLKIWGWQFSLRSHISDGTKEVTDFQFSSSFCCKDRSDIF